MNMEYRVRNSKVIDRYPVRLMKDGSPAIEEIIVVGGYEGSRKRTQTAIDTFSDGLLLS